MRIRILDDLDEDPDPGRSGCGSGSATLLYGLYVPESVQVEDEVVQLDTLRGLTDTPIPSGRSETVERGSWWQQSSSRSG
jgi:hypothetical protein